MTAAQNQSAPFDTEDDDENDVMVEFGTPADMAMVNRLIDEAQVVAFDDESAVWGAAVLAHQTNRAYCQALGDDSQPDWDDAPDWQKESAIKGVLFLYQNPDSTPEESHESWLNEKREQGWQYGPVKNPELKLHPCFTPYIHLPIEQKAKDYIFRAVVTTYFEVLGLI